MDSDDYITPEYVEKLVEEMEDCDLSVGGYYTVNSDGDVIVSSVVLERYKKTIQASEYMEWLFESKFGYQGYIWSKLYKKSIIETHNLTFYTDIFYNEDRLFLFEYLKYCKTVILKNIPLYMYLVNMNGAMGLFSKKYDSKMLSEIYAFDRMLLQIEDKKLNVYALILINACWRLKDIHLLMKKEWNTISKKDKNIIGKYTKKWFLEMYINKNVSIEMKLKFMYKSVGMT